MPDLSPDERGSSLALTNGAEPFASDGRCAYCGGELDRPESSTCYACYDANAPHVSCRHTDGTAVPSAFAFLSQAWDADDDLEARGARRHRHARRALRPVTP